MMARVRGSRAVETYLRNFEGEKDRYQEILEITLCYGVQCLARTFSLKGISCYELRTITGYDAAKGRDFYVRNASRSIDMEKEERQERALVEVRTKPSHSWRDGEEEMPDFPEPSAVAAKASSRSATNFDAEGGALYSLPPTFDEIDYLTKLLGKSFVDLVWKTFTARKGSQISTKEKLDERLLRIDQRKTMAMFPPLELPITSFTEFLGTYVTDCVRQSQRTIPADKENSDSSDNFPLNGELESIYAQRDASLDSRKSSLVKNGRQRGSKTPCAALGTTKFAEVAHVDTEQKQRPLQPQRHMVQSRQAPHSLRHVQSKIQPELQTRRQKLLRVKKTQSQRIAEALARARLAEYDARRELQDVRDRHIAVKKMPIREITTGAAALEIVDDFMKSPLMDKFGRKDRSARDGIPQSAANPVQQVTAQEDPLKEELYGTTALNGSFLGCKSQPRHRSDSQLKVQRRKYDGWLGDYGPLHTKTVRPEWNEDDAVDSNLHAKGPMFEWSFGHLPTTDHSKTRTGCDEETSSERLQRQNNDCDDDLSDALSETSDPVFQWLKDAI